MKVLLTLALASGLFTLAAAAAHAQTIEVNRPAVSNGWYPERSRSVAEKELKGAPTDKALRYPPSQAQTVIIQPRATEPNGVRVTRSGQTYVEQPIVARAEASASQARVLKVQPRTRYGTVVVHDPEAFRPARRD